MRKPYKTSRKYIIKPHYKTYDKDNPVTEQEGYEVSCVGKSFASSHSSIEACETKVMHNEKSQQDLGNSAIFGKDWTIEYQDCQSNGISPVRLSVYGLRME